MKYPNLIAESDFVHPSSMASALGLTTDVMNQILDGTVQLSEDGKEALSRYLTRPYGYLFCPELQSMNPNKFQHVRKMREHVRRLQAARWELGRDRNDYTYNRVLNDLYIGLSHGMTYANYLDAVYWVDSACRKVRTKERAREMIV